MYIHLQFTENILGGLPNSDEIFSQFIGSKSPNAPNIEDEVAAVGADEVVEKGTTIFARTKDGRPFIYDYVIKGFFKEACAGLQRLTEKEDNSKSKRIVNESGKLTAYKKIVDSLIFIKPRQIIVNIVDDKVGKCQRPLRAGTPQGERVSLASSEELAAGSSIDFKIVSFSESYIPAIKEWLDYGQWKGLGQWRNSGKGRFIWREIPPFPIIEDNPASVMLIDLPEMPAAAQEPIPAQTESISPAVAGGSEPSSPAVAGGSESVSPAVTGRSEPTQKPVKKRSKKKTTKLTGEI